MDKGYIKLSRSFFDNEIWQAARAFSECEAWLDLIQSARFEASPTTSCIGSYEVTWGRGQYPASVRFLSKKWGQSESWVRRLLDKLKKRRMITVENSQGVSVITLVNYEKYNGTHSPGNAPTDTPPDTPNILNNNELQGLVTHIAAQVLTQVLEKQATPDTPPGTPNILNNNGLQRLVTHSPAHPRQSLDTPNILNNKELQGIVTHPRHTPDTNKKKGEEYRGINKLSPKEEEKKETSTIVDGKKKKTTGQAGASRAATLQRREAFYNELAPYVGQYGLEMVRGFFDYWSELNKSGTKMRFEQQPTWELPRRLAAWERNENKFNRDYAKRINDTEGRRQSVSRLKELAGAILRGSAPGED